MRIWHEKLIPHLCRQHLLAVWREGLGCWAVLTLDKLGYSNHPAVVEFRGHTKYLWHVLLQAWMEMRRRGYKPKDMPEFPGGVYSANYLDEGGYTPWQTLKEQIAVLHTKGCDCQLDKMDKLISN